MDNVNNRISSYEQFFNIKESIVENEIPASDDFSLKALNDFNQLLGDSKNEEDIDKALKMFKEKVPIYEGPSDLKSFMEDEKLRKVMTDYIKSVLLNSWVKYANSLK